MSDFPRSQLAAYAATRSDIVSAYLFGSYATGRTHADSDIDLGIVLDSGAHPTCGDRARAAVLINAEVVGITHVNTVDTVVLNDVTPELGMSIVTRGERLHCRDVQADRAIVRRLISRYADLRPFLERTRRTKLDVLLGGMP